MWMTIALVVWVLGSGVCSLFVDFVWKTTDNLDIVEVAAVVSLWPVFVTMIILFGIAVSLYGWWTLSKRMFGCFVRLCRAFDLDEDN